MSGNKHASLSSIVARAAQLLNRADDYVPGAEYEQVLRDGSRVTINVNESGYYNNPHSELRIDHLFALHEMGGEHPRNFQQSLYIAGNDKRTRVVIRSNTDVVARLDFDADTKRSASFQWFHGVAERAEKNRFSDRAKEGISHLLNALQSATPSGMAASFADACAAGY